MQSKQIAQNCFRLGTQKLDIEDFHSDKSDLRIACISSMLGPAQA